MVVEQVMRVVLARGVVTKKNVVSIIHHDGGGSIELIFNIWS